MILTFVRSSSYGTHKMCPFQWFLNYGLGWDPGANLAADKGSLIHKALEIIARAKLAQQQGKSSFYEPELMGGREVLVDVLDEEAIELAWQHYTEGPASGQKWSLRDRDDVTRLVTTALTHSGGQFNPRNRTIVQPEQYFDIEITEPWAAYKYELPDGEILKGKLRLKGTVDLIVESSNGLEYIDWKSGRRVDWATGREKTVADLYTDFQLRLYHLALHKLYPDHDNILMSIFFLKDGGPFSMAFEKDEIPETMRQIRTWFEHVRDTEVPQRKIGLPCNTFCRFGTTPWGKQRFVDPGTDPHGNHLSICDHVHAEVMELGVDKVVGKFAKKTWGAYGGGGGVTKRE